MNVLQNNIKLPGLVNAIQSNNFYVVEAYKNSRFIGTSVPHIDPVKEVKAERLKLGDQGRNLPLTTAEQATENLNMGDYSSNLAKFTSEMNAAEQNGIETATNSQEPQIIVPDGGN